MAIARSASNASSSSMSVARSKALLPPPPGPSMTTCVASPALSRRVRARANAAAGVASSRPLSSSSAVKRSPESRHTFRDSLRRCPSPAVRATALCTARTGACWKRRPPQRERRQRAQRLAGAQMPDTPLARADRNAGRDDDGPDEQRASASDADLLRQLIREKRRARQKYHHDRDPNYESRSSRKE